MEICSESPCSDGQSSLGNTGDPSSESRGSDGQWSMGKTGDPSFRDGGRCVHDHTIAGTKEKDVGEIMGRLRDAMSVVASLVATATYQAAVNPPSSVWKNNSSVDIKCIRGYHHHHQPTSSSSSFQPPSSTTLQCPPPTFYFFAVFNAAGFITSILFLFTSIIDKWTPFAARLLFVSLTSLFLNYATLFISMTSNFSSFLAIFLIVVVVLIFFIPFIFYISKPVLHFYNKLLGDDIIYQRRTPAVPAIAMMAKFRKAEADYLPLPVSDYYPETGREFERLKVRTALRF